MNLHSPMLTLFNAFLGVDAAAGASPGTEKTFWMPAQRSTVAPGIDFVFDVITWISIFFFVLIVVVMTIFVIKYRRRSHHEKATSNVTHNTPLELTWTIIPLLLVIVIFWVGMQGYLNLRSAPAGAYEINVTAQKWSWQFDHRNGASESGILRIPVGRPVKLLMQSQDVLHACFIPAFRVKQDLVPGRITTLWFECTQAGEYDLFCAEYCGKDHSQMRAKVIALPPGKFEESLQEVADEYKRLPDWKLPEYAMEKLYPRCASCHSLDGKSGTGPSWRGMWKDIEEGKVTFTDGTKLADLIGNGLMFGSHEDYVRQSILNPQQKIVMNYTGAMPTFKGQLAERQIKALIMLIKEFERFDDKGKVKPGMEFKPTESAGTAPATASGSTPAK